MSAPRATGVVRWFSEDKGFGWIVPDDGGPDVHVTQDAIQSSGYRTLLEGERVTYVEVRDPHGRRALTVRAS
jgi:cold shock CspA family protein